MASSDLIVVFQKTTPKEDIAAVAQSVIGAGGKIKFSYYESQKPVLNGFAGTVPDSVIATLQTHPALKYIEPDGVVSVTAAAALKK